MTNKNISNKGKVTYKIALPTFVVLLIVFAAYAYFASQFMPPYSEWTVDQTGILGDSFGPLTSLFSGLAFAGIIISIQLQRLDLQNQHKELRISNKTLQKQTEELALTRTTLEDQSIHTSAQANTMQQQQFESTFFNLLSNHQILLSAINKMKPKALSQIIYSIDEGLKNTLATTSQAHQDVGELRLLYDFSLNYENTMRHYGHMLDAYLGNIESILLFVIHAKITDKQKYINIFLKQLSRYETHLMLYHLAYKIHYADPEITLKDIENFQLFKYIICEKLLAPECILLLSLYCYGQNTYVLQHYDAFDQAIHNTP